MYYKFSDEVHDYQKFVVKNLLILDNLLLIAEQLYIKNNEKGFIDILALNINKKKLVILELKNVITKDKMIWQPIRYYDFIKRAEDNLKDLLYTKKGEIPFNIDEIDYEPDVFIVVPEFNDQLLRSISYLNDINIKVIKLNLIIKDNYYETIKEVYNPISVFHKEDIVEVKNQASKIWNYDVYIKELVNKEKIELSKQFINFIKTSKENVNTYFYDKKITITVNNKVWGNVLIKNKIFESYLTVRFKVKQNVNINDLIFDGNIIDYKLSSSSVTIKFSQLPIKFLKNYI